MLNENKHGMYIMAIVAIVAIVGLVMMFSGNAKVVNQGSSYEQSASSTNSGNAGNIAGNAITRAKFKSYIIQKLKTYTKPSYVLVGNPIRLGFNFTDFNYCYDYDNGIKPLIASHVYYEFGMFVNGTNSTANLTSIDYPDIKSNNLLGEVFCKNNILMLQKVRCYNGIANVNVENQTRYYCKNNNIELR